MVLHNHEQDLLASNGQQGWILASEGPCFNIHHTSAYPLPMHSRTLMGVTQTLFCEPCLSHGSQKKAIAFELLLHTFHLLPLTPSAPSQMFLVIASFLHTCLCSFSPFLAIHSFFQTRFLSQCFIPSYICVCIQSTCCHSPLLPS